MERHPEGASARTLLTSVFGPYARDDEFGSRSINPIELYHNQVTREQGAFSLRMFHRSWGIMMIQQNIWEMIVVRTRWPLIAIALTFCLLWARQVPSDKKPTQTTIQAVQREPLRFDSVTVRLTGYLRKTHFGPLVETDDGTAGIRIRFREYLKRKVAVSIVEDSLYSRLHQLALTPDFPQRPSAARWRVDMEALVIVLKENGKPAKRFNVRGQWPVELVPIRVLGLDAASSQ